MHLETRLRHLVAAEVYGCGRHLFSRRCSEHRGGNPWFLLMCSTGMKPRLSPLDIFLYCSSCVSPAVEFGDVVLIDMISSLALVEETEVWQVHLVLFAAPESCSKQPELQWNAFISEIQSHS